VSAFRISRGLPLPSLWQALILIVGSCAGWLVWSQLLDPAATPLPAPPSANTSLDKLQTIDRIANRGPDAIPELVELLSDPDADTRRHALFGLGRIGPEAAETVDHIRERLTDDDPQVRTYAMTAFWRVSRNPEAAAGVAGRLLADRDSRVREEAARFIETLGPPAIGTVTEMLGSEFAPARILALQMLRLWELDETRPEMGEAVRALEDDPDPAVRTEALATIVACGKPTVSEIRLLLRQDPLVIFRNGPPEIYQRGNGMTIALAAVIRRGPDAAELLPDVLALVGDGSNLTMPLWDVLSVLSALKTEARPAVPRLRRLFEDFQNDSQPGRPESSVRIAETMLDVSADPDEIVAILTPLLKSQELLVCRDAGKLLCRVSPAAARRETMRLIDAMAKGDTPVDTRDFFALEGLAPFASDAVPVLIPLIDDPGKLVWATAITILGEIGPDAAPAVPMLAARLGRNSGNGRDAANSDICVAEALGRIGPPAQRAVPALLEMLDRAQNMRPDDFWSVWPRSRAGIGALSQIGDKNPPVLSALRLQLASKWPEIRAAAIEALAQLGGDSNDVLLALEQQLGDAEARVRIAAIDALASRAADSQAVLPSLLRQIDDRNAVVRSRAILAISRMNGDRSAAIPTLISALSNHNPYIRSAAAVTLGKIGREAKSAVPALQRMLNEPGNWVRNSRYWPVGERHPAVSIYVPELADLSIREAARTALLQIEE
jgi:HEAT repeat protein